jgi:LL-diaminopimelate aminotransferase
MDYIAELISERLGGRRSDKDTGTYKFAAIKEAKARAEKLHPGVQLIDMGIGEPDTAAFPEITDILRSEAGKVENRYYADNGIPEFCEAAAGYLKQVYDVQDIDPACEIMHGIGSKQILALLPSCFINPGDVTLATVPGYPILSVWTEYLGGEVYKLPLLEENRFYPDLSTVPEHILEKAKLIYINYPNNPTGQVATEDFYKRLVEFAFRHRIVVVSDAAYGALTYGGEKPLSFLSVDGAKEVGVEVHSLSKAFSMTGWRIAFLAGNSKVIRAYGKIKGNTDSGQFRAIQKAGIHAMRHPEITERSKVKYSRRFDLLVKALRETGFDAKKPKGSFYCYVKCPKGAGDGRVFRNAEEVSAYFIEQALISVVPWDDAGAWLRFSVTFEAGTEKEEEEIIQEMKTRLQRLELAF